MFVPNVGSVYYFEFLPEFEQFNDTYVVLKRMTLPECKNDTVNLMNDWYAVAGLTYEQYVKDEPLLNTSEIMKLHKPDTNIVIHAPLLHVGKIPDHTVKKYKTISIGCHVGTIAADSERIPAMLEIMAEHIVAATGIDSASKIFELSTVYLSDSQYMELEEKRDETQMQVFNYFSENVRLSKELSQLRTKLAYYEDLIIKTSIKLEETPDVDIISLT